MNKRKRIQTLDFEHRQLFFHIPEQLLIAAQFSYGTIIVSPKIYDLMLGVRNK